MCLILKDKKAFKSAQFTKGLYHYDKTDPENLKFPLNIDNIQENSIMKAIPRIVDKYRKLNYKRFNREELDTYKHWNDLQVLLLIKFYKNNWSFSIPDEKEFFPSFIFTFSQDSLKKKLDLIISYCHDHIEQNFSKEELEKRFSWSALDITYLLHYFVISHPDYKEDV